MGRTKWVSIYWNQGEVEELDLASPPFAFPSLSLQLPPCDRTVAAWKMNPSIFVEIESNRIEVEGVVSIGPSARVGRGISCWDVPILRRKLLGSFRQRPLYTSSRSSKSSGRQRSSVITPCRWSSASRRRRIPARTRHIRYAVWVPGEDHARSQTDDTGRLLARTAI